MNDKLFQVIVIGFLSWLLVALWITNVHIAGLETQGNEILNRVLLIESEVYNYDTI
jgi:hypothetical protein